MRALAVPFLKQLIKRPVQPVIQQARAPFGGEERVLDQNWLAARQAQPPYLVDVRAHADVQSRRRRWACLDLRRGEHSRPGDQAMAPKLLREAGHDGEVLLDLRLGDKCAAAAADRPDHEAALREFGQRVPQRHPADAKPRREVLLGGKPVAGRQAARCDRVGQPVLDLAMDGESWTTYQIRRLAAGQTRMPDPAGATAALV